MASFGPAADFAVWYEASVLAAFVVFVGFTLKTYLEKKNRLTRFLLWIFILYALGIMFSMISKAINAIHGTEWWLAFPASMTWLAGRLHDIRFAFVCIVLASILSYHVRVEIINAGKHDPVYKWLLYVFSAVNVGFQAVAYTFDVSTGKASTPLTVISFLLMLATALLVYVPITASFFQLARRVEPSYRRPIAWLGVTHLSFIMVFLFFGFDGLMLLLLSWPYSPFYYFVWLWALVAIIAAYLGYIKPRHAR